MSRYFKSPPPVYARNWANGQNLVESTKIERQVVASRKVHREEKKERKKQKNEKSPKVEYFSSTKTESDESEQLEKSCLTEEHHHVGYLSDGSQNSKKRRRETSPVVESTIKATPVAGKPLVIRIVFNKAKEAEIVPQEDRVCSISGTDRPNEVSSSVLGSKIRDCDESLLSTCLDSDKIAIPSESKKRKKHKRCKDSRYNALFDELVPPCISLEEDNTNSDDWLFGTKRQENASTKASIITDEDTTSNLQISGDYTLPRARFLSEVGIFSLPYTVPL